MSLVDLRRLPKHVAIIMDGNGRWAEQLGQPRTEGHRRGADTVRRIVRASRRLGIGALTLYAFSEQNWARPDEEVSALMVLLHEFLLSEREEILNNNIRLRAIGRIDRLPPFVREVLDPLQSSSQTNASLTLSLALSYGGREEIADAARDIAQAVADGTLSPEEVDEDALDQRIASVDVGPVDLMIRTGGEQRISNFLLWGSAYAELHFSPKLWPDFQIADLYRALREYQERDRRFGRVLNASPSTDQDVVPKGAHA